LENGRVSGAVSNRREHPSAAARIFTILGLAQAAVPSLVDLWIALTPSGTPSGGHGSEGFSLFLPMSVTGVAFVAFAQAATEPRLFASRAGRNRYLIFLLLLFDGVLHLFALAPHVNDPPRLIFFAEIGPIQVAGALWFIRHAEASPRPWLGLDLVLIALYFLGLYFPIGGGLETLSPLGITSKAVEVAMLPSLLALLRPAPSSGELPAPAPGGGNGGARG
jgi:hypothetical protein